LPTERDGAVEFELGLDMSVMAVVVGFELLLEGPIVFVLELLLDLSLVFVEVGVWLDSNPSISVKGRVRLDGYAITFCLEVILDLRLIVVDFEVRLGSVAALVHSIRRSEWKGPIATSLWEGVTIS
jgi:hypothetical protein